jgi:hypothetical protein
MNVSTPYVWLGPRWYAWLEFGPDNRHSTFSEIAARVARELRGTVDEVLPNPADDGKEYAEIVVGESRLLLMRQAGLGAALGAAYPDVPFVLRVAALFGAERRGWRWPLYWLWRSVGAHHVESRARPR